MSKSIDQIQLKFLYVSYHDNGKMYSLFVKFDVHKGVCIVEDISDWSADCTYLEQLIFVSDLGLKLDCSLSKSKPRTYPKIWKILRKDNIIQLSLLIPVNWFQEKNHELGIFRGYFKVKKSQIRNFTKGNSEGWSQKVFNKLENSGIQSSGN